MRDPTIHFTEEQIENLCALADRNGRTATDEILELLSKIQKVVNDHLAPPPKTRRFRFQNNSRAEISEVNVPEDCLEKARVMIEVSRSIQAIKLIRETIGCTLLEAKGVVDILHGHIPNLVSF